MIKFFGGEKPLKISDVFTPGKFPKWTFIDEHLQDKKQKLHDALVDGSMLVSISGPSKSGKTVFVEHILGKDNLIQVTGARINTPDDLWVKVFDIIGTPVKRTKTTGNSLSGNFGIKGSIEGNALVVKGKGEASGSVTNTSHEGETESLAIDLLQLLIKEIGNTDFVVFIDDFHYISPDVQSDLAHQIKEAIRNGVKFICASVPYHSDDVIRSNPDLRGRIFSIDFDYWGKEVLERIAVKGFEKANISAHPRMVSKLVDEAAGSPQLMQYLCLNTCYELDLREVQKETFSLGFDKSIFDNICRRTVASTDYSSVVDKMLEGPKTRGSDRKVHISKHGWQGDVYKFLLKAMSIDPPALNFRYQPLVDRITSLVEGDAPSGSSITNACYHAATIANGTARDSIVEWDSENDVFDIRDPYFLFFIRWSEVIE